MGFYRTLRGVGEGVGKEDAIYPECGDFGGKKGL